MHDARMQSPSAARNREPILQVLRRLLPHPGIVLELGSGSGEHAMHFAKHMPSLRWQPSDIDPAAIASIEAWRIAEQADSVLPAIALDASTESWPQGPFAAVVSINVIHIAPWSACEGIVKGAARVLAPDGILVFYGPFRVTGEPWEESNEAFDQSLRRRNPQWGVRALDDVAAVTSRHGFSLRETVHMPANNRTVVFGLGTEST